MASTSLTAAWVGSSVWAADVPNYEIHVTNEISGDLTLIDGATLEVEATVPLDKRPRGIEASVPPEGARISPDGRTSWIISESTQQVSIIDVASNTVLKQIKVGKRPRSVAFTPDGAKAYVPGELDGSIAVIDAHKLAIIGVIQLEGEDVHPMEAVVSPDSRSLYVSTGSGRQVIHIDTRIDKPLRKVTVGLRPSGLAVSPDGRRIFSANGPSNDVSVIDADSFKVIATIQVGKGPWSVAVTKRPSH